MFFCILAARGSSQHHFAAEAAQKRACRVNYSSTLLAPPVVALEKEGNFAGTSLLNSYKRKQIMGRNV
jgi:hypothetical protein